MSPVRNYRLCPLTDNELVDRQTKSRRQRPNLGGTRYRVAGEPLGYSFTAHTAGIGQRSLVKAEANHGLIDEWCIQH